MSQRQFKGIWIPAEVWLHPELTAVDKVVLMDIHSMTTREDGNYFKSNETIAEQCMCSVATIKRAIKKLQKLGWVETELRGRRRYMWVTTKFKLDQVLVQNDDKQVQKEPAAGSKRTSSNTTSKPDSNSLSKSRKAEGFKLTLFGNHEDFNNMWATWKADRKERGVKKYTVMGEEMALNNLFALSGGNHQKAIEIIKQSIQNGWQGLFPIKPGTQQRPNLDPKQAIEWANK